MADLDPVWAVRCADGCLEIPGTDMMLVEFADEADAIRQARYRPGSTVVKLRLVDYSLDPALLARERDAARAEVERLRRALANAGLSLVMAVEDLERQQGKHSVAVTLAQEAADQVRKVLEAK